MRKKTTRRADWRTCRRHNRKKKCVTERITATFAWRWQAWMALAALMRCPSSSGGESCMREVSTREAGRRYRLNGSRRYGHGGVATFSEDIVRATCIFRSARRIFLTPAQMQKRLKKDMMRERRKAFRIVLMLANERDMRPRLCFHLMPSSQTARIFWRRRSAFAVCRHVVVRPATK